MVPDGWRRAPLADVVRIARDTISSGDLAVYPEVALYSLPAFDGARSPERVPGHSIRSAKVRVPKESVLLSKLNPHIPRVWHVAPESEPLAVASTEFWPIVPRDAKDALDLAYLSHFLGSELFLHDPLIQPASSTNSHRRIAREAFGRFSLPLPPLPEQRKIAAILASVDDAIAATRTVIEQTERVKQGLLQTLMTRGIGHTRFKQTEIGEIPEEWEVVALEAVAAHITKGATPTTYGHKWSDQDDGGILFLRSECVSEDGFSRVGSAWIPPGAHESMARSVVLAGDVLVTITGNVGRVGQVPADVEEANINQHIARVRVTSKRLGADFVYFALQTKQQRSRFERIVTGLAYPQLSLKQIRETVVPVPPRREQDQIVTRIHGAASALQSQKESLAHLHSLKRGLLQDLLTGRVRVTPD